jgi:DNA-binding NarL/FixJ family response regulator
MPPFYLSVLTNSKKLKSKFESIVSCAIIDWGYVGVSNTKLNEYVNSNGKLNHIILVEVSFQLFEIMNAKALINLPNVYLVVLGTSLPSDQIAFLQESNICGFVSKKYMDERECARIVRGITQKGYVANEFISELNWINKPKYNYPRLMPKLTLRQYQIMTFLCNGKTGVEIAKLVNTSEANVRKVCEKLRIVIGVRSNAEIIVVCLSNGWVQVNDLFTSKLER